MRQLLTLLLIASLCTCVRAQSEPNPTMVAVAQVSGFSASGNSYTGLLTVTDVYSTGFIGTSVANGDRFIDATGKVYEITSISSPSFTRVTVVMTCLSSPIGSPSGTGQVWRPLANGQYPLVPTRDGEIGEYLEGLILSHNATVSSEKDEEKDALTFRDTTYTVAGLTVPVTISGPAPTVTGTAGGYTMTVPMGSDYKNLSVSGGPISTASNDMTFTIVNENNRADRSSITLIDSGNGEVVSAPKLEYGIVITQTVSGSNTVINQLVGIGGLTGFTLNLAR